MREASESKPLGAGDDRRVAGVHAITFDFPKGRVEGKNG